MSCHLDCLLHTNQPEINWLVCSMFKKFLSSFFLFLLIPAVFVSSVAVSGELFDKSRERSVPVEITLPEAGTCGEQPCPVAFISAGYGVKHTDYQFISNLLNKRGFMTVAIGHELPGDPPLSVSGNLYETRMENWSRGANTLAFVRQTLAVKYPAFDFNKVLLVGHSNGGDISSLIINRGDTYYSGLITLDHRRVPLPRIKPDGQHTVNVLSVRASDFPADKGVLPSTREVADYGICVVKIAKARHNDMADYGPAWLKNHIVAVIDGYLTNQDCERLHQPMSDTNNT